MKNILDDPVLKKIQSDINENKIIKDLEKEYNVFDLLEFNEFNIKEKLQWNSYLLEQFRLICISEKQKLNKLENKFHDLAGQKYDYYKYSDGRDLTKTEIERYYLPKDKELIKEKRLLQLQETRVSFFEALTEAFKTQGYNMKNFLDNLKIGG